LVISATIALLLAITAGLNLCQNAEKSDSAKAFGHNQRITMLTNQVRRGITRHGLQSRIGEREFCSDKALLALIGDMRGDIGKIATHRQYDDCDESEKRAH
jgi:hypothetical protein